MVACVCAAVGSDERIFSFSSFHFVPISQTNLCTVTTLCAHGFFFCFLIIVNRFVSCLPSVISAFGGLVFLASSRFRYAAVI